MSAASRSPSAAKKKPCRFCQRSRWLMSFTLLACMAAVVFLNTPQ